MIEVKAKFKNLAESFLFNEDKLADYVAKIKIKKEEVDAIREICQKIGPRAAAKYGIWLVHQQVNLNILEGYGEDDIYKIMEKYDRIVSSPAFTGKKTISQYITFMDLDEDVEHYKTQKELEDIAMSPDPDAPILFENDKYIVRQIKTRDAAIKFGLGSGRAKGEARSRREEGAVHGNAWCITGVGNSYFDGYTNETLEDDESSPDWQDDCEDERIAMKPSNRGDYAQYLWDVEYPDLTWPRREGSCENPCYYILSKEDWRFDKFCIIPSGLEDGGFRVPNRFQNNLNRTISEAQMKEAIGKDLYDQIYQHWEEWMEEHPAKENYDEGDPPGDSFHINARINYYRRVGKWKRSTINFRNDRVDVVGNVNFTILGWQDEIRVSFGVIEGSFDCSNCKLRDDDDMERFPSRVTGDFICDGSSIVDFEYLPTETIEGNFYFTDFKGNKEETLEILKKIVKGNIFLDKTEETEKDKKERQIVSFLDSVCKGEWEYRMDNGIQKVDVDGGVKIWDIELENNRLPVKFGKIKGILSLNGTNLDTLEGIPDSTSGGGITIFVGIIKSLEGFPKDHFDGSVHIRTTEAKTFKGLPDSMTGSLLIDCRFNISTPEGLPKHIGGNATISGYGGDLDELLEILKKAAPTGQIHIFGKNDEEREYK